MRRVLLPLALGLPAAALVAFVHRESPRTLVSAHGLLHAAIGERFRSGVGAGFPPENPFFAGETLPYYWCFQWAGAKVSGLLATDLLHAFEAIVVLGLVALVFACSELGRGLYGSVGAGLGIAWLLLAGALPQGPIVLLARLATSGPPADDTGYLWGIVHPIAGTMRIADVFSMYGPLFPFFLNVTARPLGIALLAVLLAAAWGFLSRPSPGRGAALAACAALLGCANSLLALSAGSALAAGFVACAQGREARRTALLAAGAIAAGIAASFPTWIQMLGSGSITHQGIGGGLKQIARMAESGWLVAALALVGLRRAGGNAKPFLLACTAAALLLSLACAVVALPVGNEDNLFHGALAILAVPAAGCLIGRGNADSEAAFSPARMAALVAVFLPTLGVQLGAFLGRPPIDLSFEGGRIRRADGSGAEARVERWIREDTDPRAVFVIDPRPPTQAVAGNSAELPALTGRTLFTERAGHYLVAPEPDGARRAAIAVNLSTGESVSKEDEALLAALGRDVFVVCREPEKETALESRYGAALLRAEPLSVYRWRPR